MSDRACLGWSLKHLAQNDLFIAILCAKMSRVNKALKVEMCAQSVLM